MNNQGRAITCALKGASDRSARPGIRYTARKVLRLRCAGHAPAMHKVRPLKLELQIQPEHARIQNHRRRSARSSGDVRFNRRAEGVSLLQQCAGIHDIENLSLGFQCVPILDTENLPDSDIELVKSRSEPRTGSDQLDRLTALRKIGIHECPGRRTVAIGGISGGRTDRPVHHLESLDVAREGSERRGSSARIGRETLADHWA